MPQTKTDDSLISMKHGNEIRRAWKAGKRTIEINGRKFKLSKAAGSTLLAFSKTDDRPKGKRQSYILVKPADGSHTPMAQVTLSEKRS